MKNKYVYTYEYMCIYVYMTPMEMEVTIPTEIGRTRKREEARERWVKLVTVLDTVGIS